MSPIAGLGLDPVELTHAHRQIGVWRLDQQVVVVVHQAPRAANPVEPADDLLQYPEKHPAIGVVLKNGSRRAAREVT